MAETPKKKPNEEKEERDADNSTWADDQDERGYYYDDAHGYEKYDPADETDDEASGGGSLDVDLDRTPPLLIEADEAEHES
jgi:hypothetical protein